MTGFDWLYLAVIVLTVGYFVLRIYEIIPNSI